MTRRGWGRSFQHHCSSNGPWAGRRQISIWWEYWNRNLAQSYSLIWWNWLTKLMKAEIVSEADKIIRDSSKMLHPGRILWNDSLGSPSRKCSKASLVECKIVLEAAVAFSKGAQLHHHIEVLICNTLSFVSAQLVNKIIETDLRICFLSMFVVRKSSIHFEGHILACTG